jgi:hypothetical protein
MVLLVLLPVYGSWLDEDFAALQPLHNHIFLDGIKPNHHLPGKSHTGSHSDNTADSDGVINVPDQDVSGSGLLFLLFLSATMVIIPDGKNGLQTILTTHYTLLNGIFPPPLKQPPRI